MLAQVLLVIGLITVCSSISLEHLGGLQALGGHGGLGALAHLGALSVGHGKQLHHIPQPYAFGYHVKDKKSDQHREEKGDGKGGVKGSYGYKDAKGLYRQVDYVADKFGYRAVVKTNEPGTANQNPAHVDYHHKHPPVHAYLDKGILGGHGHHALAGLAHLGGLGGGHLGGGHHGGGHLGGGHQGGGHLGGGQGISGILHHLGSLG